MYILPVFTTVSLIVKEKESKAKESMRMMGMTDIPYWLSWFAFYTSLNTIFALMAWAVLCINVIGASNPIYIFLYIWLYGQSVFGEIVFM
jgi:ATP-binding cassette subfamily A (ABC1) protein 7